MSKMSIETKRQALNGSTMGTRWTALFYTAEAFDFGPVRDALQAAVDEVDAQMSTWKPDSDLMRLNAAPPGTWVHVPNRLMEVLRLALDVGRASGGAFDIGMGDAVAAWGFGSTAADPRLIRNALDVARQPTHAVLKLDMPGARVRKAMPITLDLNGIAKGYGVDRLAETLRGFGIAAFLVGIDGEMRAAGLRPDGRPWAIAVEAPDPERRAPHSLLALQDAAVATSGDYRHGVTVQGQRLSHTMDPATGAPLRSPPASVTVVARNCAEADAWATALMVLGVEAGCALAVRRGIDALFLMRDADGVQTRAVGSLFVGGVSSGAGGEGFVAT
ncbi:FAD:protein FMN transferase [Aquamicrobium defluvii]|uniref:FAD:protein FMN transferase n=1 Tax=Aquamicrobium defluvii TaxID=69279 RepID=A0A011UPP9_9HYPH|nr:FAD:protein FMN transferase [Aquamicrobium defluvii]EXL07868.1 thiamine biosynthesis protein ApbE [Aquamicrobium defluvii]EZQ14960.1 thiamine biosynthesis protein ApbE [Halopseudomonas bauzanensis]